MYTETELREYLAEIREQVCSRCIERPPGGPPCAPLGKHCVVEAQLPELLDTVHQIDSPLMNPYLNQVHRCICPTCPIRGHEGCPCPGEYLLTLVVQAVETVDQRHQVA